MGKKERVTDFIFLGSKVTVNDDSTTQLKDAFSWEEKYDKPRLCIKKQRHHFVDKGPSSQSYGTSSSHVWMWELGHLEVWGPKNWCFWTVVLEKTLESLLVCKEIKPVHPQVNQPWIFIRKTDAEAPILWPSDVKRPWCRERLRIGGEEGDRGWDGWMALLTQWTWVWANSGRWWRTGKHGMLQSMGSQRVGHDLAIKWQWPLPWTLSVKLLISTFLSSSSGALSCSFFGIYSSVSSSA